MKKIPALKASQYGFVVPWERRLANKLLYFVPGEQVAFTGEVLRDYGSGLCFLQPDCQDHRYADRFFFTNSQNILGHSWALVRIASVLYLNILTSYRNDYRVEILDSGFKQESLPIEHWELLPNYIDSYAELVPLVLEGNIDLYQQDLLKIQRLLDAISLLDKYEYLVGLMQYLHALIQLPTFEQESRRVVTVLICRCLYSMVINNAQSDLILHIDLAELDSFCQKTADIASMELARDYVRSIIEIFML